MSPICAPENQAIADAGHIDDLKLAASKMSRTDRRAFQAAMTLKYCAGSSRQAEKVFGWSRQAVQLRTRGFAEDVLPYASTMADVLNRNGYRLRPVVKAKPQKKFRKPTPSSPTSTTRTEHPKAARSRD